MREQLFIDNVEIPLSRSLDPSFTKSIIDIRQPEKRNATYSKTVTVPSSKQADKVFEFIFDINVNRDSFNPNLKADVLYLVNGEEQIRGYCQLKEIIKTNNLDIEYSIVMFSEFANLFKTIQNKWLDEIEGLDTYDHILTRELQNLSTNQEGVYEIYEDGGLVPAELGKGYIYPLVDYGFSSNAATFKVTDIGCSIFVKEYWDRVFADAGFTYEFTDSDFEDHFKHLIVPSSPENYILDAEEIADREFSANTPKLTSTGSGISNNLSKGASFSADDTIIFTNEIVDDGLNYNPATGVFTCVNSGYYDFATLIEVVATLTPSTGLSVESVGSVTFKVRFEYSNGVDTYYLNEDYMYMNHDGFDTGARSTNSPSTYPDDDYTVDGLYIGIMNRDFEPPNQMFLVANNVDLTAGDTVKVVWTAKYDTGFPNYFRTAGGVYYDGNAKIEISTGAFYNKVANLSGVEGNVLKVEKCIPKVKQTDFILNYIKEYNLYFDVDPDKTDHFLIAPRDSFYTSDVVDLTGKVSIDKGITYEPVGALDAKQYLFKHKDDEDYLNTRYKESWQATYGQREIDVVNEFNEKVSTTEVSASPTPLADNGTGNNRVLPTIIQIDGEGQKISTKSNWRTLYYGGQKDNIQAWRHLSNTGDFDFYTTYPYAGHFDDPFNPSLDINFGLVREVYYSDLVTDITVTDNNLYNKYHSKFIREITDKDSKIVKCYVNMTPYDFRNWKFSDLYYFDNAYFRLNKINGYNPTSNELTKCEFLKLKEVSPFKPTLIAADGDGVPFEPNTDDGTGEGDGIYQVEYTPLKGITQSIKQDNNVYNSFSGTVSGTNNRVAPTAYAVQVVGDNNNVMGNSWNINLINSSDNFISTGVQNVTLINSDGLTITESDVTYVGGVKVNPNSISLPSTVSDITASQDVETTVKTYRCDTSSGDITMNFNMTGVSYSVGQIWYFKKVDASNNLIIQVTTGTIDGNTTATILSLNDDAPIQYCGGNEFIIL